MRGSFFLQSAIAFLFGAGIPILALTASDTLNSPMGKYITGGLAFFFLFLAFMHFRIHFGSIKENIEYKNIDMQTHVKVPRAYDLEYGIAISLILSSFFSGLGVVGYYETGNKYQLATLVFLPGLGSPGITGLVLYIKNIILKKNPDINIEKAKIRFFMGLIPGAMVTVICLLTGIGTIIAGCIHFTSIILIIIGGIFSFIIIKFAPQVYREINNQNEKG